LHARDREYHRPAILPESLAPLTYRDFALYWVAQLVSNTGTQMEQVATSWLLYRLTDSPALLGLAGLVRFAPILALTLVGGAVADRVGRRKILFVTQLGFTALSLGVGVLVVTGRIQPWHLYLQTVLAATLLAFDAPARQAMFPTLLPRHQLARAVPLNSILRFFGIVLGPAVAGAIIAAVDVTPIYFLNALSFLALVGALAMMHVPGSSDRSDDRAPWARHALEGLHYVRRSAVLSAAIGLLVLLAAFGHSPALLTIYARDVLDVGAPGLGALLSAVGIGSLVGSVALIAARAAAEHTGRLFLISAAAYAASLAAFGFSRVFVVSILASFVLGLSGAGLSALGNTIVQLASPEWLRGRVLSIHILVTRGGDALSAFEAGLAISLLGPTLAVVGSAAALLLSVAAVGARVSSLRAFATRSSA
jgi:MFS family permease